MNFMETSLVERNKRQFGNWQWLGGGEKNMDVKKTMSPERKATEETGKHERKAISKEGEWEGGGPAARKQVEGENGSSAARH